MSKVALSGNASGTGTFTLAAPNSNSDRVLTLPDEAGTVLTSASSITQNAGPAFRAYVAGSGYTTFSSNTDTTVPMGIITYDTDNCYNTSTYKFTPNVAGYYFFSVNINSDWAGSQWSAYDVYLLKNTNVVAQSRRIVATSTNDYGAQLVSDLVYMNGTTDYAWVWVYSTGGSQPSFVTTSNKTFWSGHLVRAA